GNGQPRGDPRITVSCPNDLGCFCRHEDAILTVLVSALPAPNAAGWRFGASSAQRSLRVTEGPGYSRTRDRSSDGCAISGIMLISARSKDFCYDTISLQTLTPSIPEGRCSVCCAADRAGLGLGPQSFGAERAGDGRLSWLRRAGHAGCSRL